MTILKIFNHKNDKSIIADEFIELNQIIYTYLKSLIILLNLITL